MAVNLRATHYRFGVNSGTESTHGWHANEDANPAAGVIAVDTTFLLRFTVQETGGTAAGNTDQQFQVAKNGGAFQNITTTSTIVKAVTTAVFANGADLTKRLSGTGTFESSGDGGTHDGLSGGAQNDIAASGNSETECALQIVSADVAHNDVLTFRLTSPDFTITNDVVPTLTVVETTMVETDGVITAGTTVTGVGATVAAAAGTLAAVALLAGDADNAGGPSIIEADGAITASASVAGTGAAIWLTAGALQAAATLAGAGGAIWLGTGSLGVGASVVGISAAITASAGSVGALATVTGVGDNGAAPGPGTPVAAAVVYHHYAL